MKKVIMIAAMAALMPVTYAWAGDGHGAAVPKSTHKLSSDRLNMEHERQKMSDKMSHRERGPMLNSTSKKGSDRLQGKRKEMGEMDGNKYGPMSNTTPHEHGHRMQERSDKD